MMIFIGIDLSKDFKIPLGEATQPVLNPGFHRCEPGEVRILDDLVLGDDTHGPAGKSPRNTAVVVDPMGDKFRLTAENPVPSFPVDDSKPLVEPSLAAENADKLPKNIPRGRNGVRWKRSVSGHQITPISGGPEQGPKPLQGFRGPCPLVSKIAKVGARCQAIS